MSTGLTPSGLNRALILAVVMVGTAMTLLDIAVVNVALPSIMTSLGADVVEVRWVVTAFMLGSAVVMPLTGWVGRRIGFGALFITALAFFTVGTALCASAWSVNTLVMARIIQSVGGGAIQPTAIAIITHTFPPQERGRAIGIWGISLMAGPAIGPWSGGYLIEVFDWRSAFMLNLPIGVVAIALSLVILPRDREEGIPAFDWLGYVALSVLLTASLLTLDWGNYQGWNSGWIVLGAAVTGFAFIVLLAVEWGIADVLVPLRLFRNKDFTLALIISAMRSLGMFGSLFLQPIFLQDVQGRGPIETGLIMVPAALSFAVGMPMAGWLTDRVGGRWPTMAGALLAALAFWLYRDLDYYSSRWDIIGPMLIRGIGMALIMSPATTVGMNAVQREDAGTASWMLNIGQRFGGSVTIAMLATLMHRRTMMELDRLGTLGELSAAPTQRFQDLATGLGHAPEEIGNVSVAFYTYLFDRAATTIGFQNMFVLVAAGLLCITIPAFFLSSGRVHPRPQ